MKADVHRKHAESLERAIALTQHDPATSVAVIESAWGYENRIYPNMAG